MKIINILLMSIIVLTLMIIGSYAVDHTAVDRGKALFNDPKFAGGEEPCSSCHPLGGGLRRSANKKSFVIFDDRLNSLEEAVNYCIVNANGGKAIDPNSGQMKDMVEYIKSLAD